MSEAPGAPGPLSGLLVADFSRVVAGPFAGMLLGDLGAEVVKVERPVVGDDTRHYGPPFVEVDGKTESSYYLSVNRNKKSVAWDLTAEDGRRHALELASRADVVIENFKPGGADRLGLGYDVVAALNPRVVYCSIAGIGSSRAGSALPGYDFLAQALSGLMSVTGDGGARGEPRKVGVAVVDVLTSLFALNGILAALYERQSSGAGQHVEVDLLSSALAALFNQVSTYLTTGAVPEAMGNRHPSIAPYETLMAADRPLVIAAGNDGQFAAFARVIGLAEFVEERDFARNAERVARRDELVEEIERILAAKPALEWIALLQAEGVPCGVVNDISEAFSLAGELGLDSVVRVERDRAPRAATASAPDPSNQVANPIRLSRTPVSYRLPPPFLGEHSQAVESLLAGAAAVPPVAPDEKADGPHR